jgi:hypothetical protein
MNIEIIGFWCRADGRYFGDENNDSTSRGWHHQQHLSDRVCAVSWNNTDADSARHLLPMNVYRLYEQVMLVRRVRKASNEGLSMDWLMPYMTRRRVCRGQILFRKGQPATEMFIVSSGRLRLSENRCGCTERWGGWGIGIIGAQPAANANARVCRRRRNPANRLRSHQVNLFPESKLRLLFAASYERPPLSKHCPA